MSCWFGTHAPIVTDGGTISRILIRLTEQQREITPISQPPAPGFGLGADRWSSA